ncbi:MAG: HEPN domain-containing protein [Chloroflexota bacterium]
MFRNTELNKQYRRLEALFQIAKTFEPDDEIRAHLAKYLCVLCSGFIENSVYFTLCDISEQECQPSVVLTYTKSQLKQLQNTNSEKIRKVISLFNPIWEKKITSFMQEENRGSALNYIFTDRHNIAHGRDSNITIGVLEEYFSKVVQIIKYIENDMTVELVNIDD